MEQGKFTEEEMALFQALEQKKDEVQVKLDALNDQIRVKMSEEKAIRDEVAKLKPLLVPWAEMQAGMASPRSRDKYFPDHTVVIVPL